MWGKKEDQGKVMMTDQATWNDNNMGQKLGGNVKFLSSYFASVFSAKENDLCDDDQRIHS